MEIVNNIRKIRIEKCISQKDLANAIGVSQSRMSDIERNRRKAEGYSIGLACKLAEALGCSFDELFLSNNEQTLRNVKLSTAEGFLIDVDEYFTDEIENCISAILKYEVRNVQEYAYSWIMGDTTVFAIYEDGSKVQPGSPEALYIAERQKESIDEIVARVEESKR